MTNYTTVATRVAVLLACGVAAILFVEEGRPTRFPSLVGQVVADDKPADAKSDAKVEKAKKEDEEKPVPLDLTPHVRLKVANFDKSPRFPWKAVPRGTQTYANIPVQIDGCIFLWGEGNEKIGLKYPEKVEGIAVKQKFETLYVYHACFYEGKAGDAVYEIVFHYADDTHSSEKVLCAEDVRDWYVKPDEKQPGPSGKRSVLAWTGDFDSGDRKQSLRFCLTAIENPYPKLEVTTIDLVSSKTRTAGCILSLTPGKSGLMRLPKEVKD